MDPLTNERFISVHCLDKGMQPMFHLSRTEDAIDTTTYSPTPAKAQHRNSLLQTRGATSLWIEYQHIQGCKKCHAKFNRTTIDASSSRMLVVPPSHATVIRCFGGNHLEGSPTDQLFGQQKLRVILRVASSMLYSQHLSQALIRYLGSMLSKHERLGCRTKRSLLTQCIYRCFENRSYCLGEVAELVMALG